MQKILTAAEMRRDDDAAIAGGTPSRTLMERAANAALAVLRERFDTASVLVLCGGGNNGGDGLALARFLADGGSRVQVVYGGALQDGSPAPDRMSTECAVQYALLPPTVRVTTAPDSCGVTAVVDALFGIGLTRPVGGRAAELIEEINRTGLPVLALDIPSGADADTGAVRGAAIRAAVTVAISAPKRGHYLYPAAMLTGELVIADIGIPTEKADALLLEGTDLSALPRRPRRGHKGTFGRTLIVGGCRSMSGAPLLAAKAALRTGCGLAEIVTPEENRVVHHIALPEAIVTAYTAHTAAEELRAALQRADAVAIGMGLGQDEIAALLVKIALEEADLPLVVDADALNLIAASPALMALLYEREAPTVITPHLGEMSRLVGRAVPAVASDLFGTAARFAEAAGVITVLKDARTVVSDGSRQYLNAYGNSGMATGGSGDVLAGVIASLAAQGAAPDAAAYLGVLAHAMAGDAAAARLGERSMMASDIIDGLCTVLSEF